MPADPRATKEKRDPLREAVHEPDKQEDTEEKLEDDGEPFDGNFA